MQLLVIEAQVSADGGILATNSNHYHRLTAALSQLTAGKPHVTCN